MQNSEKYVVNEFSSSTRIQFSEANAVRKGKGFMYKKFFKIFDQICDKVFPRMMGFPASFR